MSRVFWISLIGRCDIDLCDTHTTLQMRSSIRIDRRDLVPKILIYSVKWWCLATELSVATTPEEADLKFSPDYDLGGSKVYRFAIAHFITRPLLNPMARAEYKRSIGDMKQGALWLLSPVSWPTTTILILELKFDSAVLIAELIRS
jgi:hypothetical protein